MRADNQGDLGGCTPPRRRLGAAEAEALLRGHPRWQQPWLPEEG